MATSQRKTEVQLLENFRVSLTNVESQSVIASILAEYGYDLATVAQGRILLEEARNAYNLNKQEDNETVAAKFNLDTKIQEITSKYTIHRKKAKVVFRNDIVTLKLLGLTGTLPKAYASWLQTLKTFYSNVQANPDIQSKLLLFKITSDDIIECSTLITALEAARTLYLQEIGESQETTRLKDTAFNTLEHWMRDFYAVAKIAMEDQPQLLESLGLLVRS